MNVRSKNAASRWRLPGPVAVLLGVLLLTSGCAGFTARQLVRAPNTVPEFLAPKARVTVDLGDLRLALFPSQTLKVGPVPATLTYRIVEPADYQVSVTFSNHTERGRLLQHVRFRATVPAQPPPHATAPRGTIILLHGYGLDQFSMVPWALQLGQAGWRCVLVDLRGHGESTGKRIYFGTVETMDLAQLLDALETRDQLVSPVQVLGESYGASLALRWAAADHRLQRVVAIAPYPQLAPATLNLRAEFAAWFPARWVRGALERLPRLLAVKPERLDPISILAGRRLPALFIAGSTDRIAPPEAVRRLSQAMPAASAFLSVPDATHEGLGLRLDVLAGPVSDWFTRSERL